MDRIYILYIKWPDCKLKVWEGEGEGGGYKNELSGKYNSPAWKRSNNIPSIL